MLIAISWLCICLVLIPFSTSQQVFFWVTLIIWGLPSWVITPSVQSHLVQLALQTADIQQSLNITALHLAMAFGTLAGSVVINYFSVTYNAWADAALIIIVLGVALVSLHRPWQTLEAS
ncbi:MAG TPA: hypothetical protein VK032_09605 [Burkholderiaceae bacterium]|nr:hypothetical protein [Burkholderiaceae bacterium]